jgi:metal-sulfur cluster biosynthetic enzyme
MIDKDHIIANLREVYDPEMEGINVYDLGLIYDIKMING